MFSKTKDLYLNIETMLSLFETYVKGILSYGCEVCGSHKANDNDKVFIKFCRRLLRVKSNLNQRVTMLWLSLNWNVSVCDKLLE